VRSLLLVASPPTLAFLPCEASGGIQANWSFASFGHVHTADFSDLSLHNTEPACSETPFINQPNPDASSAQQFAYR